MLFDRDAVFHIPSFLNAEITLFLKSSSWESYLASDPHTIMMYPITLSSLPVCEPSVPLYWTKTDLTAIQLRGPADRHNKFFDFVLLFKLCSIESLSPSSLCWSPKQSMTGHGFLHNLSVVFLYVTVITYGGCFSAERHRNKYNGEYTKLNIMSLGHY